MLGAMLAGMVIAWERTLIGGVVLITLGVGIKATAAMALAFLVIMLALRAGGRWRDLMRCGVQVGAIAAVDFRRLHLGRRGGVRLAGRARCARLGALVPVRLDQHGRRRRSDRSAARAGRSHPGGAGRHAAGRHVDRVGHRDRDHVAVLAAPDQPDPGPRDGDGRIRAVVAGDPALVPALGRAAAGGRDGRPALPDGHDLADRAVLGDDHAERRHHPGLRHRAGRDRCSGRRRRRVRGAPPVRPARTHAAPPGSTPSDTLGVDPVGPADTKDTSGGVGPAGPAAYPRRL